MPSIRGAIAAFADMIPFGRSVGPLEWLAPDPADAKNFGDGAFPGGTGPSNAQPPSAPPVATPAIVTLAPAAAAADALAPAAAATGGTGARKAAAGGTPAPKAAARKTTVRKSPARKPAAAAAPEPAAAEPAAAEAPISGAVEPAAAPAPARKRQPARKAAAKKSAPASGPGAADPVTPAPAAVTPPVREGEEPWTVEEIAELRAELGRERERLLEEAAAADAQLAEMLRDAGDGSVDDQADAGSRTFEREQEISLAANTTEVLAEVDRALLRIDAGGYGVCENCARPIGRVRLQAFPRAALCLSCKEKQERR